MRILVTCPCGKEFSTFTSRIAVGRGKYCSKECMYKNRKRPKGLKYNIRVANSGWFKRGEPSWAKGVQRTDIQKESPGYDAIHEWVDRWVSDPCECKFCGATERLEWSNKTGKYLRDPDDWQRLCKKCHARYDYENFGARKVFYE